MGLTIWSRRNTKGRLPRIFAQTMVAAWCQVRRGGLTLSAPDAAPQKAILRPRWRIEAAGAASTGYVPALSARRSRRALAKLTMLDTRPSFDGHT